MPRFEDFFRVPSHFAGKVDEADVRAAADYMVSSGMKAAGYTYINIDDTWEGHNARVPQRPLSISMPARG